MALWNFGGSVNNQQNNLQSKEAGPQRIAGMIRGNAPTGLTIARQATLAGKFGCPPRLTLGLETWLAAFVVDR